MTNKFVSQKTVLMLVFCMLLSGISGFSPIIGPSGSIGVTDGVAKAETSVEVGDYILFGNYYGAPILWRVIHLDADSGNALVLSDRILTLKAIDAKGKYHPNKIGVKPNERTVDRDLYGSNYYPDSNIRQWLNSRSPNSGANSIDWIQNDPSPANSDEGYNTYNNEKGFLSDDNFNAIERSLIVPHTYKVMLEAADAAKKDGGEAEFFGYDHLNNDIDNFNTFAYYKEITDDVFLLTVEQAVELVLNNDDLGEGYLYAKPTPQALANTNYDFPTNIVNVNTAYKYFLSTANTINPNSMMVVQDKPSIYGPFAQEAAMTSTFGIRPAMELDIENAMFLEGGAGTANNPYVINDANAVSNPPVPQSNTLSLDAKTFRVKFNQELGAVDKTKISISLDGKTNLASTGFNAAVSDNHLVLTLANSSLTFKNNAKITILKDAVTGEGTGETNEYESYITVSATKFVSLASATMNNTNNQVNLTFATSVKGVSVGSISLNPTLESLDNQVETSVDGGKTWTAGNVESIALDGSTVEVYFDPPITDSKTMVRVKPGALSFTPTGKHHGNLNGEIKTATLDLFPVVSSATLSADNKTITLKYSEAISSATTPAPAKGTADTTLLGKIRLAADGENFLTAPASVTITKELMAITFSSALSGDANILKINDAAVQDAKKNKSALYLSNEIIADESEPEVLGLGFNKADKTLTVYFNENIQLFGSTTLTSLASGLKYNASSSFTQPIVTISKNTLVIKHKTAAITSTGTGGVTSVVIPKETLRDAANNENLEAIITDEPDTAAPTVQGYVLSNGDKDLTIEFNENIFAAKAIPLTALSITTGSGQSAVTKNLADKIWKAANTTVSIVGGNKLKIANLNAVFPIGSTLSLGKDILTDITLNKNILHQFVLYRTAEEGIEVLNTADAAYAEQQDLLNRIRELAVLAVDASLTAGERTAMQTEINALIPEMNAIATNTKFNSVALIGATPYTLRVAPRETGLSPTVHTFVAATPTALGINALNISNPANAVTAIDSIDAAMDTITDARTAIGDTLTILYE